MISAELKIPHNGEDEKVGNVPVEVILAFIRE